MMTDILLNENMRPVIQNGDFVLGDATAQNQHLLILCEKTQFKDRPMRCVGAARFLENSNPDAFPREIRQEFAADGMKVNLIKVEGSELSIDASYDSNS